MLRDLKSNLAAAPSLNPAARTATANGTAVDLQGAKSALAVLSVGAWTDGTHTPKLQEGELADGSDAADVAADNLEGAFTAIAGAGQANAIQRVGYKGTKRYLRVVMTVAGATTGAVYGAAIATEPNAKPAA